MEILFISGKNIIMIKHIFLQSLLKDYLFLWKQDLEIFLQKALLELCIFYKNMEKSIISILIMYFVLCSNLLNTNLMLNKQLKFLEF